MCCLLLIGVCVVLVLCVICSLLRVVFALALLLLVGFSVCCSQLFVIFGVVRCSLFVVRCCMLSCVIVCCWLVVVCCCLTFVVC